MLRKSLDPLASREGTKGLGLLVLDQGIGGPAVNAQVRIAARAERSRVLDDPSDSKSDMQFQL